MSLLLAGNIVEAASIGEESQIDTRDSRLQIIIRKALDEKWEEGIAAAALYHDREYAEAIVTMIKLYQSPKALPAKEIIAFLKKNNWIPAELFANRFEERIKPDYPIEDIVDWFTFKIPTTPLGKLYFLHANIERKTLSLNEAGNRNMLRHYWRNTELDLAAEEYFLKKYRSYLTIEDCLAKVEFLTWGGKLGHAERLLGILPKKYAGLAAMRIAVAQKPEALFKIIAGKTAEERSDEYLQYLYIGLLLDDGNEAEALRRLRQIKSTAFPEKWWKLRNIAIRNEFKEKHYLSAYNLASSHGLKSGSEFVEAEWLAGWIALRFLKEPDKALLHFRELYNNAKLASSISKAAYWIARTYEVVDNSTRANEWYAIAAKYTGAFYGHIALGKIYGDRKINYFVNTRDSNYQEKGDKRAWKLAKFAFYLYKHGANKFARQVIEILPNLDLSAEGAQAMARIFLDSGFHGLAINFGETMASKSGIIIKAGYPNRIDIPGHRLPKGLYLGIMRQESNFNPRAVSSAGAVGLMQLMPGTSAELSRGLGLHNPDHVADPSVNVLKGVTYVNQLFERYRNIVLTLAAYNAGPGSVNKWLSRYGDPRNFGAEHQIIDWIESIPFVQTRSYVKKVLENFVIYDSILSKDHMASSLIVYLENK